MREQNQIGVTVRAAGEKVKARCDGDRLGRHGVRDNLTPPIMGGSPSYISFKTRRIEFSLLCHDPRASSFDRLRIVRTQSIGVAGPGADLNQWRL